VRVHRDEGIANHIGPEPCTGIREDVGEASAGERIGQPWSHDRVDIPGADAVQEAEGNMSERAIASARMTRRGRRPWLCARSMGGNREISSLTVGASFGRRPASGR
jgi:hypothetical protein